MIRGHLPHLAERLQHNAQSGLCACSVRQREGMAGQVHGWADNTEGTGCTCKCTGTISMNGTMHAGRTQPYNSLRTWHVIPITACTLCTSTAHCELALSPNLSQGPKSCNVVR